MVPHGNGSPVTVGLTVEVSDFGEDFVAEVGLVGELHRAVGHGSEGNFERAVGSSNGAVAEDLGGRSIVVPSPERGMASDNVFHLGATNLGTTIRLGKTVNSIGISKGEFLSVRMAGWIASILLA